MGMIMVVAVETMVMIVRQGMDITGIITVAMQQYPIVQTRVRTLALLV
jgi:hypothetical protein